MIATAIGYFFIALGALWALFFFLIGGMTEYRATWRDIHPLFLVSIPIAALGIAIVWR